MASSDMTTTGRVVVALVGTNKEAVIANDNGPTGVGVIHQQGILSEALVSLGSGAAGSMTDDGAGTTDDDKTPTTNTEEGGSAGGVVVETGGGVKQVV